MSRVIPTGKQAIAFWMYAAGMSTKEIAQHFNVSVVSAGQILRAAQRMAIQDRIWYVSTKTKEEVPERAGSGMTYLKQLAKEAGLHKDESN